MFNKYFTVATTCNEIINHNIIRGKCKNNNKENCIICINGLVNAQQDVNSDTQV